MPEKKYKIRAYSKADLVNVQFKAYQGLLCYMDWMAAKKKVESLQDQANYGQGKYMWRGSWTVKIKKKISIKISMWISKYY